MFSLIFDTSADGCSVAVFKEKKLLVEKCIFAKYGHAEHLIPIIESCLQETKLTYQDLNLIALTKGPGSFTGLRIGLASARAMRLSLKIPVIGVNNFEAYANHYQRLEKKTKKNQLILLDTRRDALYMQAFNRDGKPLSKPDIISMDALKMRYSNESFTLVGNIAFQTLDLPSNWEAFQHNKTLLQPIDILEVAEKKRNLSDSNKDCLSPFYLAPPKISTPSKNKF